MDTKFELYYLVPNNGITDPRDDAQHIFDHITRVQGKSEINVVVRGGAFFEIIIKRLQELCNDSDHLLNENRIHKIDISWNNPNEHLTLIWSSKTKGTERQ